MNGKTQKFDRNIAKSDNTNRKMMADKETKCYSNQWQSDHIVSKQSETIFDKKNLLNEAKPVKSKLQISLHPRCEKDNGF